MKLNQTIKKLFLSATILTFAIIRLIYFDYFNERMDSTFLLLLVLVVLIPLLPWERLTSLKAGGVELTLDQPQVKGAIESLGLDRVKNKQLRKELLARSSQLKQVKGGRILWIDDKPHNIVGARTLLRALGADVVTATSSEMAEEILQRDNDFDIIITDVQRIGDSYLLNDGEPIHEGVNFIVKLRKSEDPVIKSMPVVFYAAYDWDRLVEFTRPARETYPEPKISNSFMDMLSKVIIVLSEVRLNPIGVRAIKEPTSLF